MFPVSSKLLSWKISLSGNPPKCSYFWPKPPSEPPGPLDLKGVLAKNSKILVILPESSNFHERNLEGTGEAGPPGRQYLNWVLAENSSILVIFAEKWDFAWKQFRWNEEGRATRPPGSEGGLGQNSEILAKSEIFHKSNLHETGKAEPPGPQ